MKRQVKAWVVRDSGGYAWVDFARTTRRDCIAAYIDGTDESWRWWREERGRKCVPCVVTYDDGRKAKRSEAKRAKKARGAR